jgi:hypothetical protein
MVIRFGGVAALILAAFMTISCGGVTEPSKNVVQPFSGVLEPGMSKTFPVTVNNGGEYSVKITALSPTPAAVLLLGWFQGGKLREHLRCETRSAEPDGALRPDLSEGCLLCRGVRHLRNPDRRSNFTITVSHP